MKSYQFNAFKPSKTSSKYGTVGTTFTKTEQKWVIAQASAAKMSISKFLRELVKGAPPIVEPARKPRSIVISGYSFGKREVNMINSIGKESGMKRAPVLRSIVQSAMKMVN